MTVKVKTQSPAETQKVADALAKEVLIVRKTKNALVIALTGELGAGKTTFIQGFMKGLGVEKTSASPTFILMRRFPITAENREFTDVYHIDTYRFEKEKEVEALELDKILKNPKNIVLVEWAEKVESYLPPHTTWVKFDHGEGETQRIIYINQK